MRIATVPDAPTGFTDTEVPGDNELSWTAPVNHGGFPITGYRVDFSIDGGANFNTSATVSGTSYTHVSFHSNVTHMYRIYAINQLGTSDEFLAGSSLHEVVVVTPEVPSGEGTGDAFPIGFGRISVSYTPFTDMGTDPVTGYNITRAIGTSIAYMPYLTGVNILSFLDDELDTGTLHNYRVYAVSDAGVSADFLMLSATTLLAQIRPLRPLNLELSLVNRVYVEADWEEPAGNDGPRTTNYRVDKSLDDGPFEVIVRSQRELTIDLGFHQTRTKVTVRVYAINELGLSTRYAEDTIFTAATQNTVPGAGAGLVLYGISRSIIELDWEVPVDDGGLSVTGYKIDYSTDNINFMELEANIGRRTDYRHTGLQTATTYYYRVYAINSEGIATDYITGAATTTGAQLVPTRTIPYFTGFITKFRERSPSAISPARIELTLEDCRKLYDVEAFQLHLGTRPIVQRSSSRVPHGIFDLLLTSLGSNRDHFFSEPIDDNDAASYKFVNDSLQPSISHAYGPQGLTLFQELNELAYENGYFLYIDTFGRVKLYPMVFESHIGADPVLRKVYDINTDAKFPIIKDVRGIEETVGLNVRVGTIERFQQSIIYRENLPTRGGELLGEAIEAGNTYPEDADSKVVNQRYDIQKKDVKYAESLVADINPNPILDITQNILGREKAHFIFSGKVSIDYVIEVSNLEYTRNNNRYLAFDGALLPEDWDHHEFLGMDVFANDGAEEIKRQIIETFATFDNNIRGSQLIEMLFDRPLTTQISNYVSFRFDLKSRLRYFNIYGTLIGRDKELDDRLLVMPVNDSESVNPITFNDSTGNIVVATTKMKTGWNFVVVSGRSAAIGRIQSISGSQIVPIFNTIIGSDWQTGSMFAWNDQIKVKKITHKVGSGNRVEPIRQLFGLMNNTTNA